MKPKILVVDDEESVRDISSRFLSVIGFEVRTANNGRHALEVITDGYDPNLVITDYQMAGMDGLELTKRLNEEYPEVPIIVVSGALPIVKDKINGGSYNVAGFLRKPYDIKDLDDKVKQVLGLESR